MVKEHRYLFEIPDITSLIHECLSCGKEASYRLDSDDVPAPTCAGCRQPLFDEMDAEYQFLFALRRLRKTQARARDDLAPAKSRPSAVVRLVVPKK